MSEHLESFNASETMKEGLAAHPPRYAVHHHPSLEVARIGAAVAIVQKWGAIDDAPASPVEEALYDTAVAFLQRQLSGDKAEVLNVNAGQERLDMLEG